MSLVDLYIFSLAVPVQFCGVCIPLQEGGSHRSQEEIV